jgi:hypothetical protein
MSSKRKSFDVSFKLQAVRMIEDQGLTLSQACLDRVLGPTGFGADCSSTKLSSRTEGLPNGRYRARRLMHLHGLRPSWKPCRCTPPTASMRCRWPRNLLIGQFNPPTANQAWVADIAYIRTRAGWPYLAAVLDLYSRKGLGWAMAPNIPASLVSTVSPIAIAQRQPAPGLIFHSDRGCPYANAAKATRDVRTASWAFTTAHGRIQHQTTGHPHL